MPDLIRIPRIHIVAYLSILILLMERMWMSSKMQNVILPKEDINLNVNNQHAISLNNGASNDTNNNTNRTSTNHVDRNDEIQYNGLAITTAFNHQNDSFKGTGPINASFSYIEKWYNSIQRHQPSIKGVVLHNMFSPNDERNYSNDQTNFVMIPDTHGSHQRGRRRPINDMRFFVLETVIANVPILQLPDYVIISDSHDVAFLRNPFQYMMETDRLLGERQLYVGEESAFAKRKREYDLYMNKSSVKCFKKEMPYSARMINCGLIGGHHEVVLKLLKRLNKRLDKATPYKICDQISLWYVLQKDYKDRYISGYPFNSMFMKYENQSSSDTLAYIAHK